KGDCQMTNSKLKSWIIETRWPFLTVTVIPVILGTIIAWAKTGNFNPVLFSLTFFGAVCLHLGTNIINDYFDHKSGNDEVNAEFVRPFTGGSRIIQLGLLSPLEVLIGALVFFVLGISAGLLLTYKCGAGVFVLGVVGVLSGFFYTAPVFNWASRGFGELLVGLNFGTLVSLGSYYVQTGTFSTEVVFASLPLAILVSAILWINEIPDYSADKKTDKKTLVVRLGLKKAAGYFTYVIMGSFAITLIGIALGYLPPIAIVVLVALPLAIKSVIIARKYYSKPFDMAPANGYTIMVFNITGAALIASYLWLYAGKLYVLPVILLIVAYTVWSYKTAKVQK
ncbi:MAG: 1,4-dihydroxy-2-naphthoate octaprenyltransferase, partial [Elusimicrobiota bacterium]